MKLKLDENLSHKLKSILIRFGHDVDTVGDEGLFSQPDQVVAAKAKEAGRLLLTTDVRFVDARRYPPQSHPGLCLFRLDRGGPQAFLRLVEMFVANTDLATLSGCITVVEPGKVRVMRDPL